MRPFDAGLCVYVCVCVCVCVCGLILSAKSTPSVPICIYTYSCLFILWCRNLAVPLLRS